MSVLSSARADMISVLRWAAGLSRGYSPEFEEKILAARRALAIYERKKRVGTCVICHEKFETLYPPEAKVTCGPRCSKENHRRTQTATRQRQAATFTAPDWRTSEAFGPICKKIFSLLPATGAKIRMEVFRAGLADEDHSVGNALMRLRDCGDAVYDRREKAWRKAER
jgi:hypothetical protein